MKTPKAEVQEVLGISLGLAQGSSEAKAVLQEMESEQDEHILSWCGGVLLPRAELSIVLTEFSAGPVRLFLPPARPWLCSPALEHVSRFPSRLAPPLPSTSGHSVPALAYCCRCGARQSSGWSLCCCTYHPLPGRSELMNHHFVSPMLQPGLYPPLDRRTVGEVSKPF